MVYIMLLEADRRFNSCKLPRAQMYWEAADERSYCESSTVIGGCNKPLTCRAHFRAQCKEEAEGQPSHAGRDGIAAHMTGRESPTQHGEGSKGQSLTPGCQHQL